MSISCLCVSLLFASLQIPSIITVRYVIFELSAGYLFGDSFNPASETETKIIDIANKVNEITGKHNGREFVARKDWDRITRRRASIEKAKKVLGYEPKTKVEDRIKKAFDWIMENRDRI
jgi:nucleoside-diphosphate-sugar epimerase